MGGRHRGGPRARERQHGHDHRRLDRPAGGLEDGPRLRRARSAARSTTPGSGSGRCCACSWSGWSTGAGRSRCATSTCSSCSRSRSRSAYFNEGKIFWSVPLQYPPLIYLLVRLIGIGCAAAASRRSSRRLPLWLLAGAAVFLIGFRAGLNRYNSNVIDVGYAGVIGADRLVSRRHAVRDMPPADGRRLRRRSTPTASYVGLPARPTTAAAASRPNERGDTYGPVNYAAYVPALAAVGWTGRWDDLPAAHATSVIFDALCAIGLLFAGRRLGGWRLGAALAFAWAAYPFTAYALQSNSNDMIVAAFLVWAFVALTAPLAARPLLALAAWAKFAPLLLCAAVARYPRRRPVPAPSSGRTTRAGPAARCGRPARLARRRLARARPGAGGRPFRARPARGHAGRVGALLVLDGRVALAHVLGRDVRLAARPARRRSRCGTGAIYPGFPDLGGRCRPCSRSAPGRRGRPATFVPGGSTPCALAALTGALLVGFELVPHALVLPVHPVVHAVRGGGPLRRKAGSCSGARHRAGAARSRRRASRPRSRPARAPLAGVSRAGSGPPPAAPGLDVDDHGECGNRTGRSCNQHSGGSCSPRRTVVLHNSVNFRARAVRPRRPSSRRPR